MDIDYREPSVNLNEIKDKILWDFKLKDEFKNRPRGFAFVIDVYDNNPRLALYKLGPMLSSTKKVDRQPPREMLVRAVEEQGGSLEDSNLFDASEEVKNWVKENLL